jgi:hypothetical protein
MKTYRITFAQLFYAAVEVKVATREEAVKCAECAEYFDNYGDPERKLKWRPFGDYSFNFFNIQEVTSRLE